MPLSANEDAAARGHDVVIVGGGAVGLFVAYHLRSLDAAIRVAVVERDAAYRFASTPRASGGVRRLFALPENIALSNLSIPVYEDFAALMAVGGERPDIGFRRNGYLFIVPPEGVANLERNFRTQQQHGVDVRWLEPARCRRASPSMRVDDLGAAVLSPDDGWLDPHSVLMALRRKVAALGMEMIDGEVVALSRERGRVRSVVLGSGAVLRTAAVVNATGAWVPQVCAMVGMQVPITPLRRYEHYFESQERSSRCPT